MLSDILWLSILALFITFGISRPIIALSGVVWVDILKPQTLSYSFLSGKPLSLIITIVFFVSLIIANQQIKIPKYKGSTFLLMVFIIWITVTTYYAQFQDPAWYMYDFVVKILIFSLFIPFVLNSRVKIEIFILVMITAISYFTIISGYRGLLDETQYGRSAIRIIKGGSSITETSTLAMVSVFSLPIIYYLYKHSLLKRKIKYFNIFAIGFAISCIFTSIGTYARTGLVGIMVLVLLTIYRSKSKLQYIFVLFVMVASIYPFISQEWKDRMMTMSDISSEGSALGRIVVWRWTLDYVNDHPILGGGFYAYMANQGQLYKYQRDNEVLIHEMESGKAFHNIYFQVLGEQGYIGLSIYTAMLIYALVLYKNIYNDERQIYWKRELSKYLSTSLIVFCVCGLFIGVAYTPWPFYFLGLAVALNNGEEI